MDMTASPIHYPTLQHLAQNCTAHALHQSRALKAITTLRFVSSFHYQLSNFSVIS
jgi:hypothetical protein